MFLPQLNTLPASNLFFSSNLVGFTYYTNGFISSIITVPVNILWKNGASEIESHFVLTHHRKGWLPKVFP
jgi:hypothetical protein